MIYCSVISTSDLFAQACGTYTTQESCRGKVDVGTKNAHGTYKRCYWYTYTTFSDGKLVVTGECSSNYDAEASKLNPAYGDQYLADDQENAQKKFEKKFSQTPAQAFEPYDATIDSLEEETGSVPRYTRRAIKENA